jgi:NADPH:quinone reductase-like Zn-dependent oxidoreductase
VGIDTSSESIDQAARRHAPEGVDLALDLVGGEQLELLYETVKPGGRLISLAAEPDQARCKASGITGQARFVEPRGSHLERIARHFDDHALKTHVQKIYPLAKAAEAHRVLEQGHVRGKLVLNL